MDSCPICQEHLDEGPKRPEGARKLVDDSEITHVSVSDCRLNEIMNKLHSSMCETEEPPSIVLLAVVNYLGTLLAGICPTECALRHNTQQVIDLILEFENRIFESIKDGTNK